MLSYKAEKNFKPFEIEHTRSTFNDIASAIDFATEHIEVQFGKIIRRAIVFSDEFLEEHGARIQQRIDHGLKRDIHGDLHCGNIFLYSRPVLFDCIEFNDAFRQIDVLYEVAFLCMDLERFRQKHLSAILIDEYKKHFPAFQKKEDHGLFVYYKALRANIRAKVHIMQWSQTATRSELSYHIEESRRYISLMNEYLASLNVFA